MTLEYDGVHPNSLPLALTKREMFAAMAMQGICANGLVVEGHNACDIAKFSIESADALIAELSKEKTAA